MREDFVLALFVASALGLATLAGVIDRPIARQQFVYVSQSTLNGARIGIFQPRKPISIGVLSESGPRAMAIGDVLNCTPFELASERFEKTSAGEEPFTLHQNFLNCGPLAPGGVDRILAIVGIEWHE